MEKLKRGGGGLTMVTSENLTTKYGEQLNKYNNFKELFIKQIDMKIPIMEAYILWNGRESLIEISRLCGVRSGPEDESIYYLESKYFITINDIKADMQYFSAVCDSVGERIVGDYYFECGDIIRELVKIYIEEEKLYVVKGYDVMVIELDAMGEIGLQTRKVMQ